MQTNRITASGGGCGEHGMHGKKVDVGKQSTAQQDALEVRLPTASVPEPTPAFTPSTVWAVIPGSLVHISLISCLPSRGIQPAIPLTILKPCGLNWTASHAFSGTQILTWGREVEHTVSTSDYARGEVVVPWVSKYLFFTSEIPLSGLIYHLYLHVHLPVSRSITNIYDHICILR